MYTASSARYSTLPYHRCGQSGLLLPAVSLGFWHNFGDTAHFETMKQLASRRSTTASPTLTLPTTTAPHPAAPRRTWAAS